MLQTQTHKKRTLIFLLIGIAVLVTALTGIYFWLLADLPDIDTLDQNLNIPSIRITDRKGRLLYEIIPEETGRHTVVPLEEIPLACQQATIATEDANFYRNPGVDARGIVRAMWINLRGGEVLSGGSTITQQVIRNLLFEPEERTELTLRRKLRESILAYQLTQQRTKNDILALYLNQSYYGNLAYGIDAAARAYFNTPVNSLDLAECALLAGLPQAPTLYDPLTDPEAAKERQLTVLRLMQEQDYINAEQVELTSQEPLDFAAERYSIEAPHFVMTVYAEVETLLPAEVLLAGGLEVRTTLDLDWQHAAEAIIQRQLDLLNNPQDAEIQHNANNAALVALDPHTGHVLAMPGSPDYFDASISGALNLALLPRQPGSALKPFTYALVFDPQRNDPWTAATMVLDVNTTFTTKDGFPYTPINFDRSDHGPVLVREALASSYNIPAVVALNEVGVNNFIAFLSKLGISTLSDPALYDLALTLGGGEVRLLELTAAYGSLANGGYAVNPILILDITQADGTVLYKAESGVGEQVIDARIAWLISDILSDNYARAPAFTTHSVLQIGQPAAVKTGTTTDFRDNWTIGYTPNLVVGVWVGNASGERMLDISGISGAGPIWHHFMREILRGQPELEFERPEDLTQVEICTLSGLLPTPDCPYTSLEWFISGTEPVEYDNIYTVIENPLTGGKITALNLPPQAHEWARAEGLPLVTDIEGAFVQKNDDDLVVLSPTANTVYQIDPDRPLDAQKLYIRVAVPSDTAEVLIYINNAQIAILTTQPFETWWTLTTGEHTLHAESFSSSGERLRSAPVIFQVNTAQ